MYLPEGLLERLKAQAADEGRPYVHIVRDAVDRYLTRRGA